MSSILVPIDGSPQSMKALRFAISLARDCGDELVLLSVHSTSPILGEHMLREAADLAGREDVPFRTKVKVGPNPIIEINFEANDPDVRLIVMGLRGAGSDGSSGRTPGSVSQGLLQIASRPVALVP